MKTKLNPRILSSEPLRRCSPNDCHAACCLNGSWVDLVEIEDILNHAAIILPHMPPETQNPKVWFDQRREPDQFSISGEVGHTGTWPDPVDDNLPGCIFLRPDHRCALQVAAITANLHPWRFKPFYCILHPLELDEQGWITLDSNHKLLGESGSCLRAADHLIPLLETFSEELRYLLGENSFQQLRNET